MQFSGVGNAFFRKKCGKKCWISALERRKQLLFAFICLGEGIMSKKNNFTPLLMMLPFLLLSGGNKIGDKATSMSIIYGVTTVISLLLLVGYFYSIRKKEAWFIVLFTSVFVVNAGYLFLASSDSLTQALWANRISYLGSVFLPLSMIMIILKVTNLKYSKYLP